jgi:hypothetical protein
VTVILLEPQRAASVSTRCSPGRRPGCRRPGPRITVTVRPGSPEAPRRTLLVTSSLQEHRRLTRRALPTEHAAANARTTATRSVRPAMVTISRAAAPAVTAPSLPRLPAVAAPASAHEAGAHDRQETPPHARSTGRPASAGEKALAQDARRWTILSVDPSEVAAQAARRACQQLLAVEKDLILAGNHSGTVADGMAHGLLACGTGHFASLMTLIGRWLPGSRGSPAPSRRTERDVHPSRERLPRVTLGAAAPSRLALAVGPAHIRLRG